MLTSFNQRTCFLNNTPHHCQRLSVCFYHVEILLFNFLKSIKGRRYPKTAATEIMMSWLLAYSTCFSADHRIWAFNLGTEGNIHGQPSGHNIHDSQVRLVLLYSDTRGHMWRLNYPNPKKTTLQVWNNRTKPIQLIFIPRKCWNF